MQSALYKYFFILRKARPFLPFFIAASIAAFEFFLPAEIKQAAKDVITEISTNPVYTFLIVFGFFILWFGRINMAIITFLPFIITWSLHIVINYVFYSHLCFPVWLNMLAWIYFSSWLTNRLIRNHTVGERKLWPNWQFIVVSVIALLPVAYALSGSTAYDPEWYMVYLSGLLTINIVSYLLIPVLFRLLVTNRNKQNLEPITFQILVKAFLTSIVFLISSQGFTFITLVPVVRRDKREKLLTRYAGVFLKNLYNVDKRYLNVKKGTFDKPSVVICNHRSFMDIPLMVMFSHKLVMLTTDWIKRSRFFKILNKYSSFFPVSEGYEISIDVFSEKINQGYSIMIFPEGKQSTSSKVNRFHKGAFFLADELKLDIQLLVIHTTGDIATQGSLFLKTGRVIAKELTRINYGETNFGENYQEKAKAAKRYIAEELDVLKKEYDTPLYFRKTILNRLAYMYPELEWLAACELRKNNNYTLINSIVSVDARIIIIGSGIGVLSNILALCSDKREITAFESSEKLISIAESSSLKNLKTQYKFYRSAQISFAGCNTLIISKMPEGVSPADIELMQSNYIEQMGTGDMLIINREHLFLSDDKISKLAPDFIADKVSERKVAYIILKRKQEEADK